MTDSEKLAAYDELHDTTPVTEEWFRDEVGDRVNWGGVWVIWFKGRVILEHRSDRWQTVKYLETRGEVRMAIRLFGVGK